MAAGVALYVHIPFCARRCAYCDFNTYAGLEQLRPAYVAAVRQEMALQAARYPGLKGITLYFGGGTPSLLPPEAIATLIATAREQLALRPEAEVTLEANPGTVDEDRLRALRAAGVNRLSLGVQSAHDDELAQLGRIHTWPQAVQAVEAARAAGFDNLSLDLMYGLPGQTRARWQATLDQALTLAPEHLSLYALTVEEETPLAATIAAGRWPAPDPDVAAEMYEVASERLASAGFWQYELSNWARGDYPPPAPWANPAFNAQDPALKVSQHNLVYWRNEPWLGLGAGAHSWLAGWRWGNIRHPAEYVEAIRRQQAAVSGEPATEGGPWPVACGDERELIARPLEMGETMMLGLRLAEGVSEARFRARFGVGLAETYGPVLARFGRLGLLEWDGTCARLSRRGRLLGNQVFAEFLP